jgi:hypothetical protein
MAAKYARYQSGSADLGDTMDSDLVGGIFICMVESFSGSESETRSNYLNPAA